MAIPKPAPEPCDLCGATIEPKKVAGSWLCICPGPHATGGSLEWTPTAQLGIEPTAPSWEQPKPLTAAQKAKLEKDAVTENLLGPLRKFFENEHRLVEHGVIEDWLRDKHFGVYKEHIDALGHRMFGKPSKRQPTASNHRFKIALQRLEREGLIKNRRLPSTGAAWAHDSEISFWHRADIAPTETITWADHRAQQGKSDDWTDEDKAGLNPPPFDHAANTDDTSTQQ